MSQQYDRQFSFVAAGPGGSNGLDLKNCRIRFHTRQYDIQSWNSLEARVTNLSDDTAQKVQNEFAQVYVQAAFGSDALTTIFQGEIKLIRRGRENQTDTFFDIVASCGLDALQFAIVNKNFGGGGTVSTLQDVLKECQRVISAYGIADGWSQRGLDLSTFQCPRGQSIYGPVRDVLRWICQTAGLTYSIIDNELRLTPYGVVQNKLAIPPPSATSDDVVVLTRKTGLIGVPEQQQDGLHVRCLLNPRLKASGYVEIASELINRATLNVGNAAGFMPSPQTINAFDYIPELANVNGIYRIVVAEHIGDNRGTPWYTDLICVKPGSYVPALVSRGLIQ